MTAAEIKDAFVQSDTIRGLESDSMNIDFWDHNNNWSVLFVCQSWDGLPKVLKKRYAVEFRFINARVGDRISIHLTLEPKKA